MTTTRRYSSTDPGAPTLTGEVGSLASLLKLLLVGTGGVAYGSGPDQKAAAGWTAHFETGNKIAFRNSLAEGGTGMYLRVDDGGTGSAGAREALCRCYSAMSDIDTGSDTIPPTGSYVNGGVIRKSDTLNTTARRWHVRCDELTLYIAIEPLPGVYVLYGCGDFESEVIGDAFRFFQAFGPTEGSAAHAIGVSCSEALFGATEVGPRGSFVARRWQQDTGPETWGIALLGCNTPTGNGLGAAGLDMPGGAGVPLADPSAGSAHRYYFPALIGSQGILRGRLRGVYACLNDLRSQAWGAADSSVDGLPPGSELTLLHTNADGSTATTRMGVLAIESALPWS